LDGLRVDADKAVQVVNLLVEGVGIRAISRLTGLHQETVLNVLESAGENCAKILDEEIKNIQVESVEVDETWSFVFCKQRNNRTHDPDKGDQYLFLGIDSGSKLIISHISGKRQKDQTAYLIHDLGRRIVGHFQLTSDGFDPYTEVVPTLLAGRVDFAQLIKEYSNTPNGTGPERRYSVGTCISARRMMRCGNPQKEKISTSYVERTNLSIRTFNRRFTRLSLG
jgi:IS1 family transposase